MSFVNPRFRMPFRNCLLACSVIGLSLAAHFPASAQLPIPNSAQVTQEKLSQLGAQVAILQQESKTRTQAQRKLDSQLVYAIKQMRHDALFQLLPNLRPGVKVLPGNIVKADIDAPVTPALLLAIKNAGGVVIAAVSEYHDTVAWIPLAQLEQIATLPGVRFIKPACDPVFSTDSEGDTTQRAILVRQDLGITGAGIKVGVLSNSVDHLSDLQSEGLMPTVNVLSGQSGLGHNQDGEGTAMLEIVYDLAPDASLFFATGEPTEAQMATNIKNLRSVAKCDIIVDDIHFADEPPFQDGIIAQAVNTVTQNGALYFSCAFNNGNVDSSQSATWEGDFLDSTYTLNGEKVLSFNGKTGSSAIISNSLANCNLTTLAWADPLGKATNVYNLYVAYVDASGNLQLAGSSTGIQNGAPYQGLLTSFPDGYFIIVTLSSGSPRFLHVVGGQNDGATLSIGTNGSTCGHNAAATAFTIAAVDVAQSYPNPFSTSNTVETFSSDGPRRIFFNPSGTAITPGNFTSTGGKLLAKPDFTASDGVTTDVPGFAPFHGTSAAAPHAAAIAALLKSYQPSLTYDQLGNLLSNTSWKIMSSANWNQDSGFGLIDAFSAAVVLVASSLNSTITINPTSVTGGTSATGTVSVSTPAPPAGLTLALSSSSASASVPGSVTLSGGDTQATFNITTKSVTTDTTVTVTASAFSGISTATGSLTVIPAATANLSSVTVNPTAVNGGVSSTGTVTLSAAAPTGGLTVSLSSSSAAAKVPASVTVAAGSTSATFSITTTPVTAKASVTITAKQGSVSKTATLTVNAPAVTGLSLNPTSVTGGTSSTGSVTLSGKAPAGGAKVSLSSSDTTSATVPASVTVAAGSTSATFTVTTKAVTATKSPVITATYPTGTSETATLTVKPAATATLSSATVSPISISGGHQALGTVLLTSAAPTGGAVVKLAVNNANATAPASVTVPAGKTLVHFLVTTRAVTSNQAVTLTATYASVSKTARFTVLAIALAALTLNPASVEGGLSTSLTISLNGAATQNTTVTLSSSNKTVVTVPASVTIPSGASAVTILLDTNLVNSQLSVTLTAKAGTVSKTAVLTVTP